jgi:hypothetical protein
MSAAISDVLCESRVAEAIRVKRAPLKARIRSLKVYEHRALPVVLDALQYGDPRISGRPYESFCKSSSTRRSSLPTTGRADERAKPDGPFPATWRAEMGMAFARFGIQVAMTDLNPR